MNNKLKKLEGKEQDILSRWEQIKWEQGPILRLAKEFGVTKPSMRVFLSKRGIDTGRKIPTTIKAINKEEAAYIAGIIDGEGCISAYLLRSRNSFQITAKISVSNCSKELIEYLIKITGMAKVQIIAVPNNKNWREQYRWDLSARQAYQVIKKIYPYLIVKKRQAELMMELVELKLQSIPGRRFKEERQFAILEELKKANFRGKSDN